MLSLLVSWLFVQGNSLPWYSLLPFKRHTSGASWYSHAPHRKLFHLRYFLVSLVYIFVTNVCMYKQLSYRRRKNIPQASIVDPSYIISAPRILEEACIICESVSRSSHLSTTKFWCAEGSQWCEISYFHVDEFSSAFRTQILRASLLRGHEFPW